MPYYSKTMQELKLNSPMLYDSFEITLEENRFPIAFANKLKELQDMGVAEKDARLQIAESPIELELYYEINRGLMAVEAEEVENSSAIYSPYTGEQYEEFNDGE